MYRGDFRILQTVTPTLIWSAGSSTPPSRLKAEMMPSGERTAIARITNAFLAMRKFDLAARGKA
jgi:hypothetical protein